MEGSTFKKVNNNITIGGISPDARDLLDEIMESWDKNIKERNKHYKNMPQYQDNQDHYGFAYWLVRWCGLVRSNKEA